MITERELTGSATGYIEKGSTSGTIYGSSQFLKYESTDNFQTYNNGIISTACPNEISDISVSFSIKLSDDCKKWIFSYSPVFKGYYDVRSTGCVEYTFPLNQLDYYGDEYLTEETYPEVTSAYPSVTMKLVYHGESNTSNYPFDINTTGTTTIEAVVTPINSNNLNSINELYDELDEDLKYKYFFMLFVL